MNNNTFNHGSLFSGIGGFDLAAEWMGWNNIFHCEWNEFGQKVLKHYWPNSISYGDITKTDFTIHRRTINVLSGGFPCQPYSVAGKRKGKEDERHLWPEMLRAIQEIAPDYVLGENVAGLISWNGGLVFNEVQTDLENEGYEVQPIILPACAVNAPHRRDRVWFVAKNTKCNGRIQRESEQERSDIWEQRDIGSGSENRIYISEGITTNSISDRYDRDKHSERNYLDREQSQNKKQTGNRWSSEVSGFSSEFNASDPTSTKRENGLSSREAETYSSFRNNFINYGWRDWPTQPPICSRNDGIPTKLDGTSFYKWRNESIKAYGNAIVPQVAFNIFKAIQQADDIYKTK